ncbi:pyridoxal-phosphate dependent enzyme [Epibacterium sp. SM1969]|uniref:Pyridoxal-phosphate dependent enzyme n=1 Tax=Tritonibacter aquimaris TaxID=2663379 RepID=A0A844B0T7_9RHOB|nr:pyridoxal-phosphate dependent enzyme [Tritonibacter aquimaris]MQY43731.1 pyridoxal-phosphate dependent enzyme [Tritonibacter aquimaris]
MTLPSSYVSLQDIMQSAQRIAPVVRKTPLVFSEALSERAGFEIWLKLENLQTTGSFKLRGASNRILQLSSEEKARVVVCSLCPENKRQAMRDLGAEVIVLGDTQDEAQAHADQLIETRGYTWADPYDDLHVIAGQGTIALETLSKRPDTDMIVAPLSGGGLLSGIALAAKSVSPAISVVGASMEVEPGMARAVYNAAAA